MKTANPTSMTKDELSEIERMLPLTSDWDYTKPVGRLIAIGRSLAAERDAARSERDRLAHVVAKVQKTIAGMTRRCCGKDAGKKMCDGFGCGTLLTIADLIIASAPPSPAPAKSPPYYVARDSHSWNVMEAGGNTIQSFRRSPDADADSDAHGEALQMVGRLNETYAANNP